MTFAPRTQFHVERPWGQRLFSIVSSVLNVKAVVAAFNQEKALVGAFSVITMERLYMEAQDELKMIAPPLFLNIFFYFLLV